MDKNINRKPTPPGMILRERFLKHLKISRRQLAEHLGWSVQQVNRICDNEAAINSDKAVQLGAALNTSPQFWLTAQNAVDVWKSLQTVRIPPVLFHVQSRTRYEFGLWKTGETKILQTTIQRFYSALSMYKKKYKKIMKFKTKTINANAIEATKIK